MLDTTVLLLTVPQRYRILGISSLDTYFAMARGYQGPAGDVKALAMKKWFNTNHYLVPEIDSAPFRFPEIANFDEFLEARIIAGLKRSRLIGPFTFLTLSSLAGTHAGRVSPGSCPGRMPPNAAVSMSWTRHGCSWTSPLLSVTWTGRISTCFSACMNHAAFKGRVRSFFKPTSRISATAMNRLPDWILMHGRTGFCGRKAVAVPE